MSLENMMNTIKIKGYEYKVPVIRDSHDRRAQQFKNDIINTLHKIGVREDDTDIPLKPAARMAGAAMVEWIFEGHYLRYDYKMQPKFVENLYFVSKVLEREVASLLSEEKSFHDFLAEFSEPDDLEKTRREARALFELEEGVLDMGLITKRYKILAKKYHPDVEGGDSEKFKRVSNAFHVLQRELQ